MRRRTLGLLTAAQAAPLDELQQARIDLLRGQIAFASGHGSDAPPMLLQAAGLRSGCAVRLERFAVLPFGDVEQPGWIVDVLVQLSEPPPGNAAGWT